MAGRRRIVTVAGASVVAPDAPTLTAPTEAADIYDGVAVTLTATVTAGQVPDRIDFVLDAGEVGETVVATDSTSPYSQSWTPSGVSAGAHTLTARFVYGSGSVDSAAVNVVLFDPTVITGLVAWYDPAAAYITKDGSNNVTAWANRAGSGGATWDLTLVPSTKPVWGATAGRNGGAGVTFAANSIRTGAIFQAQPFTVVHSVKPTTIASKYLSAGSVSGYLYGTAGANLQISNGASLNSAATFTPGSWSVASGVNNGASSVSRIDGTATSGNSGANAWSAAFSLSYSVSAFSGVLAHTCVYSVAVSSGDLARLEAWAAAV